MNCSHFPTIWHTLNSWVLRWIDRIDFTRLGFRLSGCDSGGCMRGCFLGWKRLRRTVDWTMRSSLPSGQEMWGCRIIKWCQRMNPSHFRPFQDQHGSTNPQMAIIGHLEDCLTYHCHSKPPDKCQCWSLIMRVRCDGSNRFYCKICKCWEILSWKKELRSSKLFLHTFRLEPCSTSFLPRSPNRLEIHHHFPRSYGNFGGVYPISMAWNMKQVDGSWRYFPIDRGVSIWDISASLTGFGLGDAAQLFSFEGRANLQVETKQEPQRGSQPEIAGSSSTLALVGDIRH